MRVLAALCGSCQLPKAGQACYVTLTGSSPQQKTGILAVAAATAQFP